MKQTGTKKVTLPPDSYGTNSDVSLPISKAIVKYLTQKQLPKNQAPYPSMMQNNSGETYLRAQKPNLIETSDKNASSQHVKRDQNMNKDRKTQTHLKTRNGLIKNNFFGNNTDECRIFNSIEESSEIRAESEERLMNNQELLPSELKGNEMKRFQSSAERKEDKQKKHYNTQMNRENSKGFDKKREATGVRKQGITRDHESSEVSNTHSSTSYKCHPGGLIESIKEKITKKAMNVKNMNQSSNSQNSSYLQGSQKAHGPGNSSTNPRQNLISKAADSNNSISKYPVGKHAQPMRTNGSPERNHGQEPGYTILGKDQGRLLAAQTNNINQQIQQTKFDYSPITSSKSTKKIALGIKCEEESLLQGFESKSKSNETKFSQTFKFGQNTAPNILTSSNTNNQYFVEANVGAKNPNAKKNTVQNTGTSVATSTINLKNQPANQLNNTPVTLFLKHEHPDPQKNIAHDTNHSARHKKIKSSLGGEAVQGKNTLETGQNHPTTDRLGFTATERMGTGITSVFTTSSKRGEENSNKKIFVENSEEFEFLSPNIRNSKKLKKSGKKKNEGSAERGGKSSSVERGDSSKKRPIEIREIRDIVRKIDEFLDKSQYLLQNEGIVTNYLEKFLGLLLTIGMEDPRFEKLFDKIRIAVEEPVNKIMEHFMEVRDVLIEQSAKLEELEQSHRDNQELQYQLSLISRENEKLEANRNLLSHYILDTKNLNLKEVEKIFVENFKLKQALGKQRKLMNESRIKEEKVMRLLYAIRKKGIDIDQIYKEEVKTPLDENSRNITDTSEKPQEQESMLMDNSFLDVQKALARAKADTARSDADNMEIDLQRFKKHKGNKFDEQYTPPDCSQINSNGNGEDEFELYKIYDEVRKNLIPESQDDHKIQGSNPRKNFKTDQLKNMFTTNLNKSPKNEINKPSKLLRPND